MGELFTRCQIYMDTRARIKPSNDRGEFALRHETDNKLINPFPATKEGTYTNSHPPYVQNISQTRLFFSLNFYFFLNSLDSG